MARIPGRFEKLAPFMGAATLILRAGSADGSCLSSTRACLMDTYSGAGLEERNLDLEGTEIYVSELVINSRVEWSWFLVQQRVGDLSIVVMCKDVGSGLNVYVPQELASMVANELPEILDSVSLKARPRARGVV